MNTTITRESVRGILLQGPAEAQGKIQGAWGSRDRSQGSRGGSRGSGEDHVRFGVGAWGIQGQKLWVEATDLEDPRTDPVTHRG